MEDYLNKLFGTSDKDEDPRRSAELKLAWRLLDIVLEHGQEILTTKRRERLSQTSTPGDGFSPSSTAKKASIPALTAAEEAVFHRPSYYGWTEGMIAGGVTFGVLFGGLRLAAMRNAARTVRLPPRRNYSDLDNPAAGSPKLQSRARSRNPSHIQQQQQQQPSESTSFALGDDVMVQLQFMCAGAIALAAMSFTANAFNDIPKFYRELSVIPLQAGKSRLCSDMCPELVEQLQRMQQQQQQQQSNTVGDDATILLTPVTATTTDIWQDPATEELESMVRLVQNCQQRMALEAAIRKDNNENADSAGELVDIPEPGVPPHYLGVSVDTTHGNEWAQQLVQDQPESSQ
jgi:hypothetical protein